MPRLPIPGKDNGTWGDVLNDYLSQSHKADGSLKADTVTAAQIKDGTIQESQLDSAAQGKLNASGDWNSLSNKPTVIASGADQATARAAIGAGTSNLTLGTTSSTAKAGDYQPAAADITDATASGQAVLTGTSTEARMAIEAISPDDALTQTTDYAIGKLPVGHYTPANKADGAVGPFDSGQAVSSFGNAIGAVSGGVIAHTPSATPSAAYYQVNAGARIRRVGCEVRWPAGAVGALAIVLPVAAWATGDTAAVAGVHLVMYGNGVWHCSRWNAPGETNYAEYTTHGRYANVWDGEWHSVELWIDTDTGEAILFFPDGGYTKFQADTIADDTGNFVIWEQFENNGADVPCEIRNLWYDTETPRKDAPVATRADIARILFDSGAGDWDYASIVSSAGTKVLDVNSAVIQAVTGSTTHTIQLPTTDVSAGHLVLVLNGTTGVVTVNSSTGAFVNALASGQSGMFIATTGAPTTAGAWRHIVFSTISGIESLTGKTLSSSRWIPRVISAASAASLTPSVDRSGGAEQYNYTSLAEDLTINAPTGSLVDGAELLFRIKDDGSSRALIWNLVFVPLGVTIPTATVISKVMMVKARYNLAQARWEVYDVKQEV